MHADFAQPGSGRRLWREAVAWRGRIDVLVNNAAIMPETPIDGDDEEWDEGWARALQVNVVEPANLMREAVRHYQAAGGGILVTMSSWVAQQGSAVPQLTAYASTKAAIKAMTQTLARATPKMECWRMSLPRASSIRVCRRSRQPPGAGKKLCGPSSRSAKWCRPGRWPTSSPWCRAGCTAICQERRST